MLSQQVSQRHNERRKSMSVLHKFRWCLSVWSKRLAVNWRSPICNWPRALFLSDAVQLEFLPWQAIPITSRSANREVFEVQLFSACVACFCWLLTARGIRSICKSSSRWNERRNSKTSIKAMPTSWWVIVLAFRFVSNPKKTPCPGCIFYRFYPWTIVSTFCQTNCRWRF